MPFHHPFTNNIFDPKIPTLLMLILIGAASITHCSLPTFNNAKFQCNSSERISSFDYGSPYTYIDYKDKLELFCSSVIIPKTIMFDIGRNTLSYDLLFSFPTLGDEIDICRSMRIWEASNEKYQCKNLFNQTSFQFYVSDFEEKYLKETGFDTYQWINYCFYCGSDRYLNKVNAKTENSYFRQVGFVIDNFPKSKFFCGLEELGIPVVMKKENDNFFPYVYGCYCSKSDMFSLRCLSSKVDIFINYGLMAFKLILTVSFNLLALIIFPYRAIEFYNRNTKGKSVVLLLTGSGSFMLFISVMLEVFDIYGVANIFTAFAILFTFMALVVMSRNKYVTVVYAITHTKPKNGLNILIGAVFAILVIGLMGISAVDIITNMKATSYFMVSICALTVLVMTFQLIWMHLALKKVSDINIFQTGVSF